jgi:hypothetical protein
VILAWTLRYLFDSFSRDLAWKYCNNKWNSPCCNEKLLYGNSNITALNFVNKTSNINITVAMNASTLINCSVKYHPITEYWEYELF